MRLVGSLLALIGVLAVVYLGVTAYLGFRVGSTIHAAEQRRIVREGAHLIGRPALERYAIHRSGLPDFLVQSPTFWLLLRESE